MWGYKSIRAVWHVVPYCLTMSNRPRTSRQPSASQPPAASQSAAAASQDVPAPRPLARPRAKPTTNADKDKIRLDFTNLYTDCLSLAHEISTAGDPDEFKRAVAKLDKGLVRRVLASRLLS